MATAESEFQLDTPGTNITNDRNTLEDEMTSIRAPLSLEAANYFNIPPSGFVSDGNVPDGHFISFGGGYLVGKSGSSECMAAAIHLPLGASIEGVEVRLNDQHGTLGEWFDFRRINLETGSSQVIGSVASPSGTTTGIVSLIDDSIIYPIVSEVYAYQIVTCIEESIYVYGVRIGYSYLSYLPTVQD